MTNKNLVATHLQTCHIPAAIRNLPHTNDYTWCWAWLDWKGKQLYGPAYALHEADAHIITALMAWHLKDQPLAAHYGLNLHKGLLLTGPIGCGKTSLLRLCKYLLPKNEIPWFKTCRDISYEVSQDGPNAILKYTRYSFIPHTDTPITYLFDDAGLETRVNFYGTLISPMVEVLLSRYDTFITFGMLTHLTTNLSASELEAIYGTRVRSRLREQYNLIAWDKSSPDKRGRPIPATNSQPTSFNTSNHAQ